LECNNPPAPNTAEKIRCNVQITTIPYGSVITPFSMPPIPIPAR